MTKNPVSSLIATNWILYLHQKKILYLIYKIAKHRRVKAPAISTNNKP